MKYGLTLYKPDGTVLVRSESFGIVFVDLMVITPGMTAVRAFPAFTGRTFKTLSGSLAQLSYPGGVPTVSVDGSEFKKIEKIYIFSL
ncbi:MULTISPECIES: hypothetical protein [unclassified Janthinobacterium]|uniref:hypothetical protein n=1 Tax=unclassified Janthinobacterium TaxID=2610881 RepID=UPI0011131CB5|nr:MULTISPECIES: hypothetical protein [unclassified Janthinobacterium]